MAAFDDPIITIWISAHFFLAPIKMIMLEISAYGDLYLGMNADHLREVSEEEKPSILIIGGKSQL